MPQLNDDDGAHGEEEELQRQHLDPPLPLQNFRSLLNQSANGLTKKIDGAGEGEGWSVLLLHTSPSRSLLLSSGNMARNTRARSWRYSSKEACTHAPHDEE